MHNFTSADHKPHQCGWDPDGTSSYMDICDFIIEFICQVYDASITPRRGTCVWVRVKWNELNIVIQLIETAHYDLSSILKTFSLQSVFGFDIPLIQNVKDRLIISDAPPFYYVWKCHIYFISSIDTEKSPLLSKLTVDAIEKTYGKRVSLLLLSFL